MGEAFCNWLAEAPITFLFGVHLWCYRAPTLFLFDLSTLVEKLFTIEFQSYNVLLLSPMNIYFSLLMSSVSLQLIPLPTSGASILLPPFLPFYLLETVACNIVRIGTMPLTLTLSASSSYQEWSFLTLIAIVVSYLPYLHSPKLSTIDWSFCALFLLFLYIITILSLFCIPTNEWGYSISFWRASTFCAISWVDEQAVGAGKSQSPAQEDLLYIISYHLFFHLCPNAQPLPSIKTEESSAQMVSAAATMGGGLQSDPERLCHITQVASASLVQLRPVQRFGNRNLPRSTSVSKFYKMTKNSLLPLSPKEAMSRNEFNLLMGKYIKVNLIFCWKFFLPPTQLYVNRLEILKLTLSDWPISKIFFINTT